MGITIRNLLLLSIYNVRFCDRHFGFQTSGFTMKYYQHHWRPSETRIQPQEFRYYFSHELIYQPLSSASYRILSIPSFTAAQLKTQYTLRLCTMRLYILITFRRCQEKSRLDTCRQTSESNKADLETIVYPFVRVCGLKYKQLSHENKVFFQGTMEQVKSPYHIDYPIVFDLCMIQPSVTDSGGRSLRLLKNPREKYSCPWLLILAERSKVITFFVAVCHFRNSCRLIVIVFVLSQRVVYVAFGT